MSKAFIGTSGWNYRHWSNGEFYPEEPEAGRLAELLVRHFATVEINNSFYRLPSEVAFQNWRIQVPPGFIFSLKASRFLTHIKRLKDPKAPLQLFFSRAKHLKAAYVEGALISAGTGTRKRAAHSATRPSFAKHS